MSTQVVSEDFTDVVTRTVSGETVGLVDVTDIVRDGEVETNAIGASTVDLEQADEIETVIASVSVIELAENALFAGGGGGAATDGATAAVIESDGFAYVGREVNDDANAVTSTWQIYRVPASTLGDTPLYADGNTNYDNDWTNRTALSYSAL